MRIELSTNTPSVKRVGYSRAVVVDNRLYISGTTSQDKKGKVVGGDVLNQAKHIFSTVESVLQQAGFKKEISP